MWYLGKDANGYFEFWCRSCDRRVLVGVPGSDKAGEYEVLVHGDGTAFHVLEPVDLLVGGNAGRV